MTTPTGYQPADSQEIDVGAGAPAEITVEYQQAQGRPGRLIILVADEEDRDGNPVDDDGNRLTDPDGRALPRASRTPVCKVVAKEYEITTRTDGAWYRCCGGKVRKLVDCCAYSRKRINGDGSLTGYCYKGRKVFCVMYFDTKVPC